MSYKIMLVEDETSLREIYGSRLEAEGYEIISASDGEEALALAVKEKPDLIISDVMMPKISGFDMLDILRTTPETKNTKIIMMTALGQAEDKERADKLGADKYLVKSQVTLEDVARTVHEVLQDKQAPSTSPGSTMPDAVAASAAAIPTMAPSRPAPTGPPVTDSTTDTKNTESGPSDPMESEPANPATQAPVDSGQSITAIPVSDGASAASDDSVSTASAISQADEENDIQNQIDKIINSDDEPAPETTPQATIADAPTAPQPKTDSPATDDHNEETKPPVDHDEVAL